MSLQNGAAVTEETVCYHCGDPVAEGGVVHSGKAFCCSGCKIVYEILHESNLCEYYNLERTPGFSPRVSDDGRYKYLDDPSLVGQLLDYSDGTTNSVTLTIPQMHCSSCVWLLENLHRLKPGVLQSRVEFLKKQIRVRFRQTLSLREIVELLASLGYEPELSLASARQKQPASTNSSLYYRIGVAGFCFGNIMLFSFPEYLGGGTVDPDLARFFGYSILLLSLPAFFYCSAEYFRSSIAGLRRRVVNLDVPIALGILVLFSRSVYEIVSQTGPGFLDSMSGLVFFLLLGRLFQAKTYESLNFERDYTSYFPLAATVRKDGAEKTVPLSALSPGDRIVVRNGDIVPADAILVKGPGAIDYSFVTGESRLDEKRSGDFIYAGGRQIGSAVELDVLKEVSESYLTQLWRESGPCERPGRDLTSISNGIAKYFTTGVLGLAGLAAFLWLPDDVPTGLNAITGVLIVACPCALALSTPFTFGTAMRVFGRNGLFVKAASVVEALAKVSTIVFDKTGTMTHVSRSAVLFSGTPLSEKEKSLVASVVRNSTHPLSRALREHLQGCELYRVRDFSEIPGEGLGGTVEGTEIRLGAAGFVEPLSEDGADAEMRSESGRHSEVYISIGGVGRGRFAVVNRYRDGLDRVVAGLRQKFRLMLLSGDRDAERRHLQKRFAGDLELHFHQSPTDKLNAVRALRAERENVMMVGDGLNDAGALRESDVGISVTDDITAFAPASDAILDGRAFGRLDAFLRLSRASFVIVIVSFVISFLYNAAGLTIAIRGELSPILAAILMPLSSITVVFFTTTAVRLVSRKVGLR
jgi:Cu+-exporting ATPase